MLTPVSGSDGLCWGSCCSSVSGEEQRPCACISRSCCKPGFVFPLPLLYSSCRRSRCCSPDTPSSAGAGTLCAAFLSSPCPAPRRPSQLCSRSVSLHQFQLCSLEVLPPPCLPRACGSACSCLRSGTTAPSPASLSLGPGELIVQEAGPRARWGEK